MEAGDIVRFANENQQLDTVSNGNDVSEDCLTLNVIRPSGYDGVSLPVGVVSKLFLALLLTVCMRDHQDLAPCHITWPMSLSTSSLVSDSANSSLF
jgi:hypothetical protein